MPIRQLTQVEINRIAAGEVIERPASAVKELVENAIDAGAASIEIVTQNGGLSLLRVTDDGCGMDEADLSLCVERHATSKLPAGNLQDIRSLGFRGEALPSLGSVAGLRIVTRPAGHNRGFEISVESGKKSGVRPAAARPGTCVEIRDLFAATPARLKFTKSERSENAAITDVVKRLALACPHIGFALTVGERRILCACLRAPAGRKRCPASASPDHGARFRRRLRGCAPRTRWRFAVGLCGAAHAQQAGRLAAISFRERQACQRPPSLVGNPRRLSGSRAARALPACCAVPRNSGRRSGCQRAPRQGRGALSRGRASSAALSFPH